MSVKKDRKTVSFIGIASLFLFFVLVVGVVIFSLPVTDEKIAGDDGTTLAAEESTSEETTAEVEQRMRIAWRTFRSNYFAYLNSESDP